MFTAILLVKINIIERCYAKTPGINSSPTVDFDLLQQTIHRKLSQDSSDSSAINVQVFHRLTDDVDGKNVCLSESAWEMHDEDVFLRGRLPIPDSEGYLQKKGNVAFIVYKSYTVEHQRSAVDEPMRFKMPLPIPEPASQDILLISDEMIEAIKAFFTQCSTFRTEFPDVNETERMWKEFDGRRSDGRYSDEYFARSDQIR
ncbi:hypothetical protein QQS21_009734 [Conoideocrella luteorostrata]|uniref:Uncharacterized protein n=1 Tax=Conoideocrella luteorostrata TaxID=1105319 RepID=A0AAJ0CGJ1_9HYPO|nr:hypothetical protein QQS21_009734 [Conoideocrella luteorostrata]